MMLTIGYAGGTWDLFHVGHLAFLEACRDRCDHLIVGVVDDESIPRWKGGRRAVIPYAARARIVGALRCVDKVVSHRLVNKVVPADMAACLRQPDKGAPRNSVPYCPELADYVEKFGITVFFHGDDHEPSEYAFYDVPLVMLPYSSHDSTTAIIARIREGKV